MKVGERCKLMRKGSQSSQISMLLEKTNSKKSCKLQGLTRSQVTGETHLKVSQSQVAES
jgi:hypothetical protein